MSTGCGAVGSALDWGSRGREFKSRHSDQNVLMKDATQKTPHESAVFSRFMRRFETEKLRKTRFPNNWQTLARGAQKRCRKPIFSTEVIRTPRLSKRKIKQTALPLPHFREGGAAFFAFVAFAAFVWDSLVVLVIAFSVAFGYPCVAIRQKEERTWQRPKTYA